VTARTGPKGPSPRYSPVVVFESNSVNRFAGLMTMPSGAMPVLV
jgi:hypothetical protein